MNWGHPDKILRQISLSTAGFDSGLNPDVVKTFSSLIYTNVMIPYLYPLGNWYATYFELALSTKLYVFSCLDLDLWIANFKIFVSFYVWMALVHVVAP